MDPMTLALTSTGINSGAGILGGILGRQKQKQTPIQKTQKQLIDQLLGSLQGNGPYSDLFAADEGTFNRNFREPAMARFRNQVAPQIQQSYIANGQQRSTGLEDTLARAGVDLDQMLNEHYLQYQQGAQNRQSSAISSILGQGPGVAPNQSIGSGAAQGFAGYLSGDFGNNLQGISNAYSNRAPRGNSLQDTYRPPKKGFEQDNQYYDPYSGVMQ